MRYNSNFWRKEVLRHLQHLNKSFRLFKILNFEGEWTVTAYLGRSFSLGELSTDRLLRSSGFGRKFVLASTCCFAVAILLGSSSAVSQVLPSRVPRLAQSGQTYTVGQRLAADLMWTQAERDERFPHMDRLFPVHKVTRGGPVRALPSGKALPLPTDTSAKYMHAEHLAGLLVLQDGQVRLEQYASGLTRKTRWTTFSVTKAVTDTLTGAALHAGTLHSLDDDVTRYLPEMRGSSYDGVTVRQLMTMTSGVRWHENYTSADADNVLLYSTPVADGVDPVIEYMRKLPREALPGSRWLYNTGETDLLGVLLRRATGRTLAEQLSRSVWQRAGMQDDATWIATAKGPEGEEFGGSGLSASLRDLGRLGLWVLEGGHGVVSSEWFATATKTQVKAGKAGYGFGWWPQGDDGSYAALGIFGQSLYIDPAQRLVIVTVGNWSDATGAKHSAARAAFWQEVKAAAIQPLE